MAKVFSICNHKGGCAKSTSAVSIAAGLARCNKRVLLIDLDPQANATQGAGIDPYTIKQTIYGAMLGRYPLPVVPVPVPDGGKPWDVVPSCLDLVAAEIQLAAEFGRERILENLLASVKGNYDYIICDCPPSLGLLTTNAMTAADSLLIPVQPHFYAVQGLQQLLEIVARVRRGLNPRLTIGGVFVADYDGRVTMHNDALGAIRAAFPNEVFKTRIRHNVALSESSARGLSIFDYAPKSNGATDYAALVAEIVDRFDK